VLHRELVEELFETRYGQMVGLATLVLGSSLHAEDVVQDAFGALYRREKPLDDPTKAVGYLYRSVINGCRSRGRRRRLEVVHNQPIAEPTTEAAEAVAAERAEMDRMQAALAQLPTRQRECLVCQIYLDMSQSEIAASLGISIGSVKTHLSRGIQQLKERLGDES
jgi:RNA polymerase sigma-70 factor (sigma-E family)